MRSFDTVFLRSSTIVVEGRSPIVEQQQISPGQKIETITVVLNGSGIAVDRRISFTEMPAYREPTVATAGDYGPDSNLIVWRPMRERGLMQSAFQGYRSDLNSILVSPNGKITQQPSGTSVIDLYRPDDMQRYSWFWNPILATGRGFSQYLRDIVEAEEIENGLIRIEARGVSHLGIELTWHLVIDPQADYLVRSASYAYDRGRFDFSSTGTKRFGSQVLAGQADLGPNLTLEIKDYRPESDSEILTATEGAFRQPLPEGARVVDWTSGQASLSL
jgi:hypothetical protein